MEIFTKDEVNNVYQNIQKNLTQEQVQLCSNLLQKIIENISNMIGQYVDIHKKIYSSNEIYHKFINYAFKDTQDQYKKLVNLGESRKYLNTANNIRSFGLFGLTRKIFGADNKNTEKKFLEYLRNIEIVLDCFNDSVETKMNFVTYFLTVLTLKEIALNTFKEYIKNIEF